MGSKLKVLRTSFLLSINATVFFGSVAIIVLLLVPVRFENDGVRYSVSNRPPSNDSLALAMTVLQFSNYFYDVPDANLNVSDGQMTEFWFLPPGTRLSPLMQAIARCRMTIDLKRDGDPQFPVEVCNRVPVGWPWLAIIVAAINLIDIVNGHMKRVLMLMVSKKEIETVRSHVSFQIVSWAVLLEVISLVRAYWDNHIGMTYTMPGDVYPQPFYRQWPISWSAVVVLCFGNLMLKTVEALGHIHWGTRFKKMKRCCKKMQQTRKTAAVSVAPNRPAVAVGTAVSTSVQVQVSGTTSKSPSSTSSSTSTSSIIKVKQEDLEDVDKEWPMKLTE